jgi:hypothetical protein
MPSEAIDGSSIVASLTLAITSGVPDCAVAEEPLPDDPPPHAQTPAVQMMAAIRERREFMKTPFG